MSDGVSVLHQNDVGIQCLNFLILATQCHNLDSTNCHYLTMLAGSCVPAGMLQITNEPHRNIAFITFKVFKVAFKEL